jgi:serine/threonine-protein kinase Chk1
MGVILFTLLAGSTYNCLVCPVNGSLRYLQPDTPWDEPTKRSPEFRRYLSGEFVIDAPWDRIDKTALCEPTSCPPDALWA